MASKMKTVKRYPLLSGYAVNVAGVVEYWKYDPAILSQKQRKQLGILGWARFGISVKEGQNG